MSFLMKINRSRLIQWVVCGSLLVFAAGVHADNITSTFNQDAEGWSVVNGAQGPE